MEHSKAPHCPRCSSSALTYTVLGNNFDEEGKWYAVIQVECDLKHKWTETQCHLSLGALTKRRPFDRDYNR